MRLLCFLLTAILILSFAGCRIRASSAAVQTEPAQQQVQLIEHDPEDTQLTQDEPVQQEEIPQAEETDDDELVEDGYFYTKEDVALYIHTYGHLPDNFITKNEALDLGWDSRSGNLWDVADGMCIGGDHFGNYEGNLPKQNGRKYYECDVNYFGGYRGGERIIYSNDGLIYYTGDHYATFEQLY